MINNLALILFLCLIMNSCADPKYVNPNTAQSDTKLEQQSSSCVAQFNSGKCISLTWKTTATENVPGTFIIKTFHPNVVDASPVLEDLSPDIAIVLWMPDMPHGSTPVKVAHVDTGTYLVSDVHFTMIGAWEIRVQLKNGNTIQDEAIIPFNY